MAIKPNPTKINCFYVLQRGFCGNLVDGGRGGTRYKICVDENVFLGKVECQSDRSKKVL